MLYKSLKKSKQELFSFFLHTSSSSQKFQSEHNGRNQTSSNHESKYKRRNMKNGRSADQNKKQKNKKLMTFWVCSNLLTFSNISLNCKMSDITLQII